MKGIRIDQGVVIYYGNAAGYLREGQAVVDPMFCSQELEDFFKEQPELSGIVWQKGVFEQLMERGKEPETGSILKNCRVWQLKPETDIMKRFIGYEELRGRFGDPDIEDYQMVYDGAVKSNDLEELYEIFNQHHPPGYMGHSLSMSDLVELYDGSGSVFYYCDRIGFQEVEVAESKLGMEMTL